MTLKGLKELENKYLIGTYNRYPVYFVSGKGIYLFDENKNKYIDFISGIAVNAFGYGNRKFKNLINRLSGGLIHTSNLFYNEQQIELARLLSHITIGGKVFFCNSGAESVEAGIKMARLFGRSKGISKPLIVSLEKSFHGRTLGALALTGQKKYSKNFEPLPEGFIKINPNKSLPKIQWKNVAAIFLEFVQGESGVNILDKGFAEEIYSLCKEKNILLAADEIQSGFGRTGKLFSYQHFDIKPDIVLLAKSLGGGFPIGAAIVKDEVASLIKYGMHGSTFGGGHFITSISKKTVEEIVNNDLASKAGIMGKYLLEKLEKFKNKKSVKKIRGIGLMAAIDIVPKARDIVEKCIKKGLIIGTAGENTIRMLPPLIIKKEQIDEALNILGKVL